MIDIGSEILYDQRPTEVDLARAPRLEGHASECRWRGWRTMLVVVFSSTAAAGPAAEVAAEAELVSRYLNGPVVSVEDLAEEAAAHAAATAPAVGIRPTLAVRQEVARGRVAIVVGDHHR